MAKRQVAAAAKKQAAKGTGRVSHRRSTVWGFRSKQFQGDFSQTGERPGTMHHAYSVYITVASGKRWSEKGIDIYYENWSAMSQIPPSRQRRLPVKH